MFLCQLALPNDDGDAASKSHKKHKKKSTKSKKEKKFRRRKRQRNVGLKSQCSPPTVTLSKKNCTLKIETKLVGPLIVWNFSLFSIGDVEIFDCILTVLAGDVNWN